MSTGENTVATLVRDRNGRLTTVHKGRAGAVGTQSAASSTKVRNSPYKIQPSVRDLIIGGFSSRALDDIADLEDQIAVKAATGLLNEVASDFPEASRIVLDMNSHTGTFEVTSIENGGGESLGYDNGDSTIYDLFAARVDVEGSLVKEGKYVGTYVIEWENK